MDEKLSLTYFLKVFRRRKWGALTVFAAIFTLVLIWTFRATPIYRSTSKVEITRNEPSLVDFSEKRLVQASTTELLNTQCQLLRSRTFMERVVSRIDGDLSSKSLRRKFEKEYPGPKKADSKELSRAAGRMMKWVKVEAYNNLLKHLPVTTPVEMNGNYMIYNQYVITTDKRDELMAFLKENDIATKIYYPVPMPLQTCYEGLGYTENDIPNSVKAANTSLALPIYPELTRSQIEYVAGKIGEFLANA